MFTFRFRFSKSFSSRNISRNFEGKKLGFERNQLRFGNFCPNVVVTFALIFWKITFSIIFDAREIGSELFPKSHSARNSCSQHWLIRIGLNYQECDGKKVKTALGALKSMELKPNLVIFLRELSLLFFACNKCNSLPFGLIWALISFYLRDLWPTYLPSQCGLPLKHYFKKDNFLLAFHSLIPKNETSILISEIRGSNPVIGKFLYRTFLLLTVKITVEKVKINKKRRGMTHFLANNKTF